METKLRRRKRQQKPTSSMRINTSTSSALFIIESICMHRIFISI